MFLLALQQAAGFPCGDSAVLIPPAVDPYNHTWPATALVIISAFIQAGQLRAASDLHEQTTVRPPGHQWTGTNHQSEWLLMELEQLPQTIKKGQKDVNSDVLKGGGGGLRSVH